MELHGMFIDPFIRQYLWDDEILTLQKTSEILDQSIKHFQEDGWGLWKIQLIHAHQIIGFCGLWYFFEEPLPQLLYALKETHIGQGYAYEASKEIARYAFGPLAFPHLIASMDKANQASQKVAQKLGMVYFKELVQDGAKTIFYRISGS